MNSNTETDRLVAGIVSLIGALLTIIATLLPLTASQRLAENTIMQSDVGSGAVIVGTALFVVWRTYRYLTGRSEASYWLLSSPIIIGINLALVWSNALTLYNINEDGSLDMSTGETVPAGIGLYVLALGALLCLGSAFALARIAHAESGPKPTAKPGWLA
jgi:hypothetical protein